MRAQTASVGRMSSAASMMSDGGVSLSSKTIGVYSRPQTTQRLVDKSSSVWREFLNGVKRRKRLIARINEMALEPEVSSSMLKRFLLELRALTLTLIEDALEIEYRSKLGGTKPNRSRALPQQLPPLAASSALGPAVLCHTLPFVAPHTRQCSCSPAACGATLLVPLPSDQAGAAQC